MARRSDRIIEEAVLAAEAEAARAAAAAAAAAMAEVAAAAEAEVAPEDDSDGGPGPTAAAEGPGLQALPAGALAAAGRLVPAELAAAGVCAALEDVGRGLRTELAVLAETVAAAAAGEAVARGEARTLRRLADDLRAAAQARGPQASLPSPWVTCHGPECSACLLALPPSYPLAPWYPAFHPSARIAR